MAIPASLSVFKIDSTSHVVKEYVRKQIQSQGGGGAGGYNYKLLLWMKKKKKEDKT